ncbi:MAG: glutamine--fructose-6-phosphate transaminase (isomerizing) [Peptoniphilaceae bacterium]
MCGIVGYCGKKNASEILLDGLKQLEYRGYDSSGISVLDENKINTVKKVGKLSNLSNYFKENTFKGNVGIGHTRWATHGIPNETNAHPHLNEKENISIVHNGIIENYIELKEELLSIGYSFKSETDSEVIAHLVDFYYKDSLLEAVSKASNRLEGSYALEVISLTEPSKLIAVRHESPLIFAISDDGYFISSDVSSIIKHTRNVIYLDNDEIVSIDLNQGYNIYNKNLDEIKKDTVKIQWDIEAASKEGYDHFMLKEIYEQPKVVKEIIDRRIKGNKLNLLDSTFSKNEIENFNKIYIVACGTAFHAGEIGKFAIQKFAKIPVITDIASEFRYNDKFIDDKTLIIVVSQSGETADTLSSLREAKKLGATSLAITNVVGSSIAREADKIMYCQCGPEISVASTKAYTAQLIALILLALDFAIKLNKIDRIELNNIFSELNNLPQLMENVLSKKDTFKDIANKLKDSNSIFYTGRGLDFINSKEGALKIKEISYIHTEAFAAGELKHGSIALIEEGSKVIATATQSNIIDKTASNVQELTARKACVYTITNTENDIFNNHSEKVIMIPKTSDILSPILSVIPVQLIAYYTALAKGKDVDKPRNLAKSVTVE